MRAKLRTGLVVGLCFSSAGLHPAPAGAAEAAAEAQPPAAGAPSDPERLFAQGKLHYELGEYEEAIVLFRRAYEETQDPGFLFNVAQAYRLFGKCRQALQVYSHFLRLAPGHPNAVAAASNVSVLESQCPGGTSAANPEAPVAAAGAVLREAPTEAPVLTLAPQLPPALVAPPPATVDPRLRETPSEASSKPASKPASELSLEPSVGEAATSRTWHRAAVASTLTLGLFAAVGSALVRERAARYGREADAIAVRREGTPLISVDGVPAPSDAELAQRQRRALTLENRADWSALLLSATAGALLSAGLIMWAPWRSWSVQAGPRHAGLAVNF